jgi:hypothetical protein
MKKLNHPLERRYPRIDVERYISPGPWPLRLLSATAIGLTLAVAYWFLFPMAVEAMLARQWL